MMLDGTVWLHDYIKPADKIKKLDHTIYRDDYLETKRLQAIHWLRTQSERGWVLDKKKLKG